MTAVLAPELPRSLGDFRDRHAGESIIVCGCGSSLTPEVARRGLTTIGVNDVGRLFGPNYLVVVNPARQFRGDRFNFVRQSRAQALFTQLDLGRWHHRLCAFGWVATGAPTSAPRPFCTT